jgi:hypothetical protein
MVDVEVCPDKRFGIARHIPRLHIQRLNVGGMLRWPAYEPDSEVAYL